MQKETLITRLLLSKTNELIDSQFFTFDLPTLVENMKHSKTLEKENLNAMVLLKGPEKQIVLTALHQGTKISSFQSNDSITFQIIEGKLDFHSKKESFTIEKGEMLTLHENIKYSLISKEETVFLLTTSNIIPLPFEN